MTAGKLQDLAAFVNSAQQGSFSGAAKKMGTSVSSVTKSIARLEAELGVTLFNRSTRKIALAMHSRDYYERCVRILADLEDADNMIREESQLPVGRVRIAMAGSFGRGFVIPELAPFFQRYPDIKLDIEFINAPVDVIKNGFDLAVCAGELVNSGLVRRVLLRGRMVVVGTPSYIEKHGAPKVPNDLRNHNCIIGNQGNNWTFKHDGKIIRVQVDGCMYMRSGGAHREAVLGGYGLSYGTVWRFGKDIAAGALVPVLDEFTRDEIPISVVYSSHRNVSRKVSAFVNYLSEITRKIDLNAGIHNDAAE